ncbi:leucine-rich repeat-containing protein 7-like isoform X4 [Mercenaria mercenaria]|uniref:leucine-rich repeat-containing protein 7-like isoform X4 n=1 Tax=Mercenaria mercenaria TaxID=6596 RepID=UPI00234F58D2|nr:leucine-rich repeat-containing protein 7-like isoform X4 [Mercenaria mercenaria]
MAKLFVRKCPCLRPKIEEDVKVLDYRHCSLNDVPGEVFNFERTLEELLVDSNQIKDLPRELFYCHGLRKLSLSDNEIKQIPAAIGHLISLENLDLSKNGVIDIPENIKTCKYLQIVDASVNPLGKLPDGFTQLLNLTQLYLNDTFLDYLPGNFGRLSKLKILEIRENHLKTLPKSFSRLVELEKLDIGQNEFSELPDVIGSLSSLLELWCDNNQVQSITPTIGNLKQLMFFDGCKNCLQTLPSEIEGCISLADLHLTTNQLQSLPDSIGELGNLTTLKVDNNCLRELPHNLGGLSALSELNVSANELRELPSSLGLLRYLRTLYADENELEFIPAELGSCSGITVLSLRSNKLSYIPDEIGRIPRLRVLNLSANQLRCLPFTIVKCKELQALWLSENQTRPLITLQSEHEPDTGRKILTCYLLPQRPLQDSGDHGGDTDSFHASMWEEERRNRQQIHFEFGDDSDVDGSLIRQPTPYPKEMREKARHLKNLALRQQMSNGSSVRQGEDNPAYEESPSMEHLMLINQEGDGIDGRMRDSRGHKPGSPSIHDPFTLYKYDKEKLAKDKARMQQRHSQSYENDDDKRSHRKHGSRENSPAPSDRSSRKGKERKSLITAADDDDGGFQGPRVSSLGSTPDIPSAMNDRVPSTKFTYCSPAELSQNLSLRSDNPRSHSSHGNHPRSHRHRRMRDYDSDTGYRSDQELIKFRRQQQQMYQRVNDNFSEIVPVTRPKGRRRDGYSSDLEGYSQRSMGVAHHETSAIDNRNFPNRNNSLTRSFTYDGNQQQSPNKSQSQYSQSETVGNDELYEQNMVDPNLNHYPSSSPSPLQRRNIIDQSTPLSPNSARSNYNKKDSEFELKKDLFNAQDQHRADGIIDPENRYMPNTSAQSQGPSREDNRPVPPYKPAPPYPSSPGQRQLPQTPNRTSPYGVSLYDKQIRNSPMKDFHQRMPDIQESRDSNTSLNRSRSQLNNGNSDLDPQDYRTSESYSRNNYMDMQNVHSDSPRTSTSDSANVSRTFIGAHQGDVTSASSKDSGNYSYHDRTLGESPVNLRNSPLSGLQERRGSRNSPLDYVYDPRRNFDRYDNSFREPATVHIPTRYDDIAMYKSDEPPSQVSSSTDSGYGHNLIEKMLESQRFSGNSKGSPSPDHFNSDSNTSSSHQEGIGQYSRGATPINNPDMPSRDGSNQGQRFDRFRVTITKNPGLGFSIAGGKGTYGNPFRPTDLGIFVTKIQQGGPAASTLRRGDKLLEVNGKDFTGIEHTQAVNVLKTTGSTVQLCVEREITS